MTGKTQGRCFRRTSPAVTFALGLFLLICLSSLMTESADAAPLRGNSPGFASCPSLHLRSSGPCVWRLQEQLDKDHVSPHLTADGRFGPATKKAVENFQRGKGLPHDGVAGPQTFRALEGGRPPATRPSGSAWYSGIPRFVENLFLAAWRHAGISLLALGGMVALIFAAAALCGVKSVRLTVSRKRVDCDIERFPPQRIVDIQADVIRYCTEVQARHPQSLPPPGDYIRSIGRGG
jgi:hypothetical protein